MIALPLATIAFVTWQLALWFRMVAKCIQVVMVFNPLATARVVLDGDKQQLSITYTPRFLTVLKLKYT